MLLCFGPSPMSFSIAGNVTPQPSAIKHGFKRQIQQHTHILAPDKSFLPHQISTICNPHRNCMWDHQASSISSFALTGYTTQNQWKGKSQNVAMCPSFDAKERGAGEKGNACQKGHPGIN